MVMELDPFQIDYYDRMLRIPVCLCCGRWRWFPSLPSFFTSNWPLFGITHGRPVRETVTAQCPFAIFSLIALYIGSPMAYMRANK
jgi:hypothetical protein